jgi:hypothetical protein
MGEGLSGFLKADLRSLILLDGADGFAE